MGDKGGEESLEGRNYGQQKQLKRKWETAGATGLVVSLNALKV